MLDLKGLGAYIVPEKEEKKKGNDKIFEEIIVENFPNMEKEIVNQGQETQSPIQDKSKEKHAKTLIKLTKTKHKKRILKAAREKQQVTCKGSRAYFSAETLQARREWQNIFIFKVLKWKNLQPRFLYPARISFRIDGEIESFPDKQKLREFSPTNPSLQQM